MLKELVHVGIFHQLNEIVSIAKDKLPLKKSSFIDC